MKRLYISIILTCLMSLFFLGWILDQVYDATTSSSHASDYSAYRSLSTAFVDQLSATAKENLEARVRQLSLRYDLEVKLEAKSNLVLPNVLSERLLSGQAVLIEDANGPYLISVIPGHDAWLINMALPKEPVGPTNINILLTIALYGGLCFILIVWLTPLTRRLRLISKMADRFGQGDLSVRLAPTRWTYIEPVEKGFNRMAEQVETLFNDNRLLAQSLSHDLRTPLACLRFGIDAIQEAQSEQQRQEYFERIEKDLLRIENMMAAFLEYASLEREALNQTKGPLVLGDVVAELIKQCSTLSDALNKQLSFAQSEQVVVVQADRLWLEGLITNLVTNAIQHCRSEVHIALHVDEGKAKLIVEDDGKGIPVDKMKDVFKPFVKLDKSRTQKSSNSGFGLGLAIVNKVASWYQWQVYVENSKQTGGAVFTVVFSNP
ncbi:ATP-binding protein [Pleionea sp. CnH1-48]|uniref:ATP-binding protein n=1 Tax=Pleionea sp. CnH1-48 TaxID=2954494 RepID=UPI0020974102|nr:ATP-binding protein [Pleionea sp. CnH1-48]MCO7224301.1 ATP-binding protein [Pleionea sp. CnH1-48]